MSLYLLCAHPSTRASSAIGRTPSCGMHASTRTTEQATSLMPPPPPPQPPLHSDRERRNGCERERRRSTHNISIVTRQAFSPRHFRLRRPSLPPSLASHPPCSTPSSPFHHNQRRYLGMFCSSHLTPPSAPARPSCTRLDCHHRSWAHKSF